MSDLDSLVLYHDDDKGAVPLDHQCWIPGCYAVLLSARDAGNTDSWAWHVAQNVNPSDFYPTREEETVDLVAALHGAIEAARTRRAAQGRS